MRIWNPVGTKSVNLPIRDTISTITLSVKIKYLAILWMWANLKNRIKLIEINNTMTAPRPAFSPKILINSDNPSSGVDGIVSSDVEIFSGIANLIMFAAALIENKINNIKETVLACFFRLGNRFRMPLPKIAP